MNSTGQYDLEMVGGPERIDACDSMRVHEGCCSSAYAQPRLIRPDYVHLRPLSSTFAHFRSKSLAWWCRKPDEEKRVGARGAAYLSRDGCASRKLAGRYRSVPRTRNESVSGNVGNQRGHIRHTAKFPHAVLHKFSLHHAERSYHCTTVRTC
jgi:hypothetical protein